MSPALLSVLLVAGLAVVAPTSASTSIQVDSTTSPYSNLEIAARMPLQPVAVPVPVVAAGTVPERRSIPQSAADGRSSTDGSGWRTYGTLLAILVLMAAIALRRHKAGEI